MKSFLKEPTQAAFAIIDEFVDLVLRAEKVEQEWQIFLRDFALIIWEEELSSEIANNKIKKDWIDIIVKTSKSNKLDCLGKN